MAEFSTEIEQLIQEIRTSSPNLYQAISMLNQELFKINNQLNPLVQQSIIRQFIAESVNPPTFFEYSFPGRTVRFTWDRVDGASFYEVRQGNNWDTATFRFRTSSLQADIDPLLTGSYTFLIKAVTADLTYSAESSQLEVIVPIISGLTVTNQVIDNNVLLSWNTPTGPFQIDHYLLEKNGVPKGESRSNFAAIIEPVTGEYVYTVNAVDIAGNISSEATTTAIVRTSGDFQLQTTIISDLSGTKSNCYIDGTKLIGPVVATRTWAQHFSDRSWDQIQDQLDAGYPVYLQPNNRLDFPPGSALYEEVIHFGVTFSAAVVSVSYNVFQADDDHPVTFETFIIKGDISIDSDVDPVTAAEYLEDFEVITIGVKWNVSDARSAAGIYNLTIKVDVKKEHDGGIVSCVSTDSGGTIVTFNKAFKAITSIVATPIGTVERKAVVNFTSVPNPTTFKALLFDTTLARVSGEVRWIARGDM